MTTYFITRHTGALQWAAAHDIHFDIHLEHLLSLDKLQAGDVIIGTLPINMIYQINQLGVRYLHLSFVAVKPPTSGGGYKATPKLCLRMEVV